MSARSLLPGLANAHPLGPALPALYQEDDLAQRLTAAFDEALAPVLCTLDSLDAYFDPRLAPDDFLAWLGRWVGLAVDESWPVERRRLFVARAVELYRRRGTGSGLAEEIELSTGTLPEIVETGGTAWSQTPEAPLPGDAEPRLTVRLRVPDPQTVDIARLEAFVAAAKPAHVVAQVEVIGA